ncbi:hypothetical protein Ciccas_011292 [Cichlidogyrus casuarinus]|uniref:Uncharacterized protein n=1 Tax=Cichlidogyrus casuarinus TaxID=1844966 RepID=A0ABD2PRP8_9PLAT
MYSNVKSHADQTPTTKRTCTSTVEKSESKDDTSAEDSSEEEASNDYVPENRELQNTDKNYESFDAIYEVAAQKQASTRDVFAFVNATIQDLNGLKTSAPYKYVSHSKIAKEYRKRGLTAMMDHLSTVSNVIAIGFDGKKNNLRKFRMKGESKESITVVQFPNQA